MIAVISVTAKVFFTCHLVLIPSSAVIKIYLRT